MASSSSKPFKKATFFETFKAVSKSFLKDLKKIVWNIRFLKWSAILIMLFVSAFLILLIYRDTFGFGSWETGSVRDIKTGEFISTGPGPGQLRFKQLLITFFGGGALALAGVFLQKVTRNNLAEVSILGIGSINIMFVFAYVFIFKGEAFGSSLVSSFLPLVTVFASILGTLIIWLIARSKKANRNTFVIVGIALQLLFEAISVIFINPNTLSETTAGKKIWATVKNYSLGNVESERMPFWLIVVAAVFISLGLFWGIFTRRKLDIYETSPALARSLGINVERLKLSIYLVVALLAGFEAAILGNVALLGIIAPSAARWLFKNKFTPLAIGSFLIGGTIVMLASVVEINLGANIPTGILATAISVPYFGILILRGR